MSTRKQHSATFKSKVALEALKGIKTISEIAAQYGVHPTQISNWKRQALDGLPGIFDHKANKKKDKSHDLEIQELHAKIGELLVEKDFLARASRR